MSERDDFGGTADPARSLAVHFTTLTGNPITVDPAPQSEDAVGEIKQRIAAVLGLHFKQVGLLLGVTELADDAATVGSILANTSVTPVFTVIQHPCQVKPSCYSSNIQRKTVALIDMPKLGGEFKYLVDLGIDHAFLEPGLMRLQAATKWRADFPPPQDININMMPFIIGNMDSIPAAFRQYWPLIEKCTPLIEKCAIPWRERGRVGYLTIHESLVKEGHSLRRGGVHIDPDNRLLECDLRFSHEFHFRCGLGVGCMIDTETLKVCGGIYVASSVTGACRAWNVRIRNPAAMVGHRGDLEHIRELLGEDICMEAGKLYWITDTTPYEYPPLKKDTYCQYFRLVTSTLSSWYPEKATPNPLGIAPDPMITKTKTR